MLHSPAVQVVVQLHGEDGGCPALILAAFIACGTSEGMSLAPSQRPQLPTKEASGAPGSARAWLKKLGKALSLVSLIESICIMGEAGVDSKVSKNPPSSHSLEVRPGSIREIKAQGGARTHRVTQKSRGRTSGSRLKGKLESGWKGSALGF